MRDRGYGEQEDGLVFRRDSGRCEAAMASIAANLGSTTETLRLCVRRAERGNSRGAADGTGDVAERLTALEDENRGCARLTRSLPI